MAPAKSGREIIIESSTATIVIVGRNLRIGAHKIANRLCGSIEAFDPERRDMPGDPQAPFVKSIWFYDPPSQRKDDQDDEVRPPGAAKATVDQSRVEPCGREAV